MKSQKELLVSIIIQIFVALGGFIGIGYQVKASNDSAKLTTAITLYDNYLDLAFENPAYADGFTKKCSDENKKCEEWEKYEWFVSRLLFSAESILDLDLPEEAFENWERTLQQQLKYHKDYLQSEDFKPYIDHYSSSLTSLLSFKQSLG